MTREEAIRLLSGLMFKGKLKEALDMAIKSLEQAPIIKESKEYITKQALEDTLMTAYKHQLSDHDAKLFVEFMSFVDDLPSVTPQEPILNKIFSIVHPLSIMSTPELEHKAIMQIAEMLEPLCLPESEET